ncbi:MAG: biotin transporter BioY [Bacillota bacterium]|nr:biotin transporter BioY [Bacillota bacterium]
MLTAGNFNLSQKKLPLMCRCALFTALIAVGAFIKIPVPYFDYFTLQFFFVLLSGMVLGAKWGAASVLLYVAIGLLGLPVFAAGGGIGYVVRPSFGFLSAFIFTSWAVGLICQGACRFRRFLLGAFVGFFITYAIGLTYKYFILNFYTGEAIPFWLVLASAFPLDIPGDIILSLGAAFTGSRLKKLGIGAKSNEEIHWGHKGQNI